MDRMEGKFYRIQFDEWKKMYHELTKSQIGVLIYIKTADPFANGARIKASVIAEELQITKRAVNSAIAVLAEKGFIEIEEADYIVKVTPKVQSCDSNTSVTEPGKKFPAENGTSRKRAKFPTKEDNFPPKNENSHSAPETPNTQESQAPKIYKDFKDFKDSLSVEERESFEKFGLKMASDLPSPPQLPKKWIAKNWEEIRDKWLLSTKKPSDKQTHKWADHPQRTEWLEKINTLGFGAFIVENGDFDDERKEFVDWAFAAGLVE